MRGRVAMLGNPVQSALYLFPCYHDVPKPGKLFDRENYISTVTTQIFPDFCISEIGMSKNYNELGSYVEINTAYRQFEIPSENERHFHVDEMCLISDHTFSNSGRRVITQSGMEFVLRTIAGMGGANTQQTDISVARVYTKAEDKSTLAQSILPVVSTAVGTSLMFCFRFEDNYSAGSSAQNQGTETVTSGSQSESREYKYTKYESYGDYYARAKYMSFELFYKIPEAVDWLEQAHYYPRLYSKTSMGGDIAFGSQK